MVNIDKNGLIEGQPENLRIITELLIHDMGASSHMVKLIICDASFLNYSVTLNICTEN